MITITVSFLCLIGNPLSNNILHILPIEIYHDFISSSQRFFYFYTGTPDLIYLQYTVIFSLSQSLFFLSLLISAEERRCCRISGSLFDALMEGRCFQVMVVFTPRRGQNMYDVSGDYQDGLTQSVDSLCP